MTSIKRMYGAWSALPGREVEALGVSIGPFSSPDDESSVVAYLRRHKRVVVRDWKSKAIADRHGVRVSMGGDIAALHPSFTNADRRHGNQVRDPDSSQFRIAIVPHAVSSDSFQAYMTGIVEFTEEVSRKFAVSVRVLCLNSHADVGDRNIAERVVEELTERGYVATMFTHSTASLGDSIEELRRAHGVISTRLHGSIAAYLLGVPFVSLNYHEKCSEFCEDVGVPQELRVGPASGPESYRVAALALVSGAASPSMSPGVYVERASNAYFAE
jgi:polysaccharide pyruvyl transferase WcaK-like protein